MPAETTRRRFRLTAGRLLRRCEHDWQPDGVFRGWAFERCQKCDTRRVAP